MGHKSYFSDYEPVTRSRRNSGARVWKSDESSTLAEDDERWVKPSRVGPSTDEAVAGEEITRKTHYGRARSAARGAKRESSILKRGHALSYAGLFLYTIAVFFRPYEFSDSLAWSINVAFWFALFTLAVFVPTQLSLDNTITVRTREVNLLLLLTLIAILAMPLGVSPGGSFEYFTETFIKIVIMFIVMVNVVRTERRLKGLFLLTITAGCVSSLGAIADYRAGNFTVEGYRVMGKIGVYGLFGNPDDMALHLITMIPIAVALIFTTRNIFYRLLLVACILLMLVGTIFSFSRGCFLGLLAVAAVLAWKLGRRSRTLVFAMLLMGIAAIFALAPGYFATRIISIFDHSLDPVGSAGARKAMLFNATLVALRHPLLGIGMGNFHLTSVRNLGTHNAYLQVAAELGFPALAVYVMFMVHPIKRLYRIERETYERRRSSRFYYLSTGLQASLVGFMVSSTFLTVAFNWNIYYLVAYAVCLRRMYEGETAAAAALSKEVAGRTGEKSPETFGGRERFAALDVKQ